MAKTFDGFDLSGFWKDSDYARQKYVEEPLSDELVSSVEAELGVRLPASYLELMKTQNGGIPHNTCFPTKVPTSWAKDHVAVHGIMGVGSNKVHSLGGGLGSKFMQGEWGYPDWGICVCDCPSAGHDMIMLDYRKCGRDGEPEVVHVDQEQDYKATFLATNFGEFIRGLVNVSVYDTSAEDLKNALEKIESGSFSPLLTQLISNSGDPTWGTRIRNLCRKLTNQKGYFALHADELSVLAYDKEVWLCYYTDFPLVRLLDYRPAGMWQNLPVSGSHSFAVGHDRVLICGGYKERDRLFLVALQSMAVTEIELLDTVGTPIKEFRGIGRRSVLHITTAQTICRLDVNEL